MAWTQFPKNFEVLEVDESMLNAKVRTTEQGLAKVFYCCIRYNTHAYIYIFRWAILLDFVKKKINF